MNIRFLTSGESHGPMLTAIVEGIPAGLSIHPAEITVELKRRQGGYGRGDRSISIEKDTAEITGGVRWGKTIGSPISIVIRNKDWENRKKEMSVFAENSENISLTRPRPGHADLAGALKYGTGDIKPILERASARSTATQVAVGSICKKYLLAFGIEILGYVRSIGTVDAGEYTIDNIANARKAIEKSPVRCPRPDTGEKMKKEIDDAKTDGDTLGGTICLEILGVPIGLGSYIQYDTRLDANLAQAIMGIPSVKSVVIGDNDISQKRGSNAHDEIFYDKNEWHRKTNHAGGIEGGISNGENIRVNIGLKPIPTLLKPLESADLKTKEKTQAVIERSDVCVAPSAVVVTEAMAAIVIARSCVEKFGGDSMEEVMKNFKGYVEQVRS